MMLLSSVKNDRIPTGKVSDLCHTLTGGAKGRVDRHSHSVELWKQHLRGRRCEALVVLRSIGQQFSSRKLSRKKPRVT